MSTFKSLLTSSLSRQSFTNQGSTVVAAAATTASATTNTSPNSSSSQPQVLSPSHQQQQQPLYSSSVLPRSPPPTPSSVMIPFTSNNANSSSANSPIAESTASPVTPVSGSINLYDGSCDIFMYEEDECTTTSSLIATTCNGGSTNNTPSNSMSMPIGASVPLYHTSPVTTYQHNHHHQQQQLHSSNHRTLEQVSTDFKSTEYKENCAINSQSRKNLNLPLSDQMSEEQQLADLMVNYGTSHPHPHHPQRTFSNLNSQQQHRSHNFDVPYPTSMPMYISSNSTTSSANINSPSSNSSSTLHGQVTSTLRTLGVKQSEPLIISSTVVPLRSKLHQPSHQQSFDQEAFPLQGLPRQQQQRAFSLLNHTPIQETVAFSPSSPPASTSTNFGAHGQHQHHHQQQQQGQSFSKSPISGFSSNSLLSSITICSPTTPPSVVFHKIITGLNSVTMKSGSSVKSPAISMSLATNEPATRMSSMSQKEEQEEASEENMVDNELVRQGEGHNNSNSIGQPGAQASTGSGVCGLVGNIGNVAACCLDHQQQKQQQQRQQQQQSNCSGDSREEPWPRMALSQGEESSCYSSQSTTAPAAAIDIASRFRCATTCVHCHTSNRTKLLQSPRNSNCAPGTISSSHLPGGSMFSGRAERDYGQCENLSKEEVQNQTAIKTIVDAKVDPVAYQEPQQQQQSQQQQLPQQQQQFPGPFEQHRQQLKSVQELGDINDSDFLLTTGNKNQYPLIQQQQSSQQQVYKPNQRPSLYSQISRSSTGSIISTGKSASTSISGMASSRPSLYSSDSGVFGDSIDGSVASFDPTSSGQVSEPSTPQYEFTSEQQQQLGDENLLVVTNELTKLETTSDHSSNGSSAMTGALTASNPSAKVHQMTLRPRNGNNGIIVSASINSATPIIDTPMISTSASNNIHNLQLSTSMIKQLQLQQQGHEVFAGTALESNGNGNHCASSVVISSQSYQCIKGSSMVEATKLTESASGDIVNRCSKSGDADSASCLLGQGPSSDCNSVLTLEREAPQSLSSIPSIFNGATVASTTGIDEAATTALASSRLTSKANWCPSHSDNVVMNSPTVSSLASSATTIGNASDNGLYSTSPSTPAKSLPNNVASCNLLSYPPPKMVAPEHRYIINKLRSDGYIRSDKIYQVMLHVNFANFGWSYSYSDASFIASELENCANLISEGSTVLVINSWYYLYIPLCLSLLVGPTGYVVGHGDEGIEFVRKDHSFILDTHRLILVDYDWEVFKKSGFSLKGPYDVILIHKKYFSPEIKEQLKPSGVAFDQVDNVLIYAGNEGHCPTGASKLPTGKVSEPVFNFAGHKQLVSDSGNESASNYMMDT